MENRASRATNMVIMEAAGRDFQNFNMTFRANRVYKVVAFTAAQIPNVAGCRYPRELAGESYWDGIPIVAEEELESVIATHAADQVIFAYSDVSHEEVMHRASRALAAGADFRLLGPRSTMLRSRKPKTQAKRFKKLRLEMERARATHRMIRQAGKRSRRGKG